MRKPYNWENMKQEYFTSPSMSVRDFFATNYPKIWATTYQKRAKGWQKEKQDHQERSTQIAITKVENDPFVIAYREQIIKGKNNALKLLMQKLTVANQDKLSMRDLATAIDVLRRELGEPSTIAVSDNNNNIAFGDDLKNFMLALKGDKKINE